MDTVQVYTTLPSAEAAQALAQVAVAARVAACVQTLGPITSTYRWQGQVETASEWLCIFKTSSDAYPALETLICQHHPYEIPEILALPVTQGYQPYVDWLKEQVTQDCS